MQCVARFAEFGEYAFELGKLCFQDGQETELDGLLPTSNPAEMGSRCQVGRQAISGPTNRSASDQF